KPARAARPAASPHFAARSRTSLCDSARGVGDFSVCGTALGATSSQPSQSKISGSSPRNGLPPSQGRLSRALRPEWPSCRPATAPCALMKEAQRASAGMNASFHNPVSPTVPQPLRATFVDSMMTRPAPPWAYFPALTRCQSVAKPSTAEYWCMGATTTRFFRRTLLISSGENSIGCVIASSSPFSSGVGVIAAPVLLLVFSGQRFQRRPAGIFRLAAQFLLDPQQLVVFCRAVGPRQRTGLDLSAIGRDREIGDGGILRLTGAMRHH